MSYLVQCGYGSGVVDTEEKAIALAKKWAEDRPNNFVYVYHLVGQATSKPAPAVFIKIEDEPCPTNSFEKSSP